MSAIRRFVFLSAIFSLLVWLSNCGGTASPSPNPNPSSSTPTAGNGSTSGGSGSGSSGSGSGSGGANGGGSGSGSSGSGTGGSGSGGSGTGSGSSGGSGTGSSGSGSGGSGSSGSSGSSAREVLYFGSQDSNGVGQYFGYAIDTSTGKIGPNQVPGSPYAGGNFDRPRATAIAADKYLYFIEQPSAPGAPPAIMGFTITTNSGALTPISGMPLYPGTTNNDPSSLSSGAPEMAVSADPKGRYLFVATDGGGVISYAINGSTGQLTQVWSLPTNSSPTPDYALAGIATDHSGSFIYAVSSMNGNVYGYRVGSGGVLTAIPGSPYAAGPSASDPCTCLAVDKSNTHLYVGNQGGSSISAFTIDQATGGLTPIPGSPFPTANAPVTLTADPAASYLYAGANWSRTLSGYAIGPNGALTPVPSSPYSLASSGLGAVVEPAGRYLYVYTGDGIQAYAIDPATGEAHQVSGGPFAGDRAPAIFELSQ